MLNDVELKAKRLAFSCFIVIDVDKKIKEKDREKNKTRKKNAPPFDALSNDGAFAF